MKIAVAADGTQVSAHFGHCTTYLLADVRDGEVIEITPLDNPGHQPGFLPGFLHSHGVECVIAGGMGPRAVDLFTGHGIRTVLGVTGPIEEALAQYVAGDLEAGESLCDHDSPGHKTCTDSQ